MAKYRCRDEKGNRWWQEDPCQSEPIKTSETIVVFDWQKAAGHLPWIGAVAAFTIICFANAAWAKRRHDKEEKQKAWQDAMRGNEEAERLRRREASKNLK